jgi:ribose transport system substrate-binding protein
MEACVAEASAAVEAAKTRMEPVLPATPLDQTVNAGKTIWVVFPLAVPIDIAILEGMEEAAAAAGMEVMAWDAGDPQTWSDGIRAAIQADADAIFVAALDPQLIDAALQEAEDAGIPTIGSYGDEPDVELPFGVDYQIGVNYRNEGKVIADYVLANTGCEGTTVLFSTTIFPSAVLENEGIQAEFDRLCPDACELVFEQVDFADLATTVPVLTQTVLRRTENVNMVIAAFDIVALFVNQGIEQEGLDVKVVAHDGDVVGLDAIRSGESPQVATLSFPPGQYFGWVIVDQLSRLMAGQEPDRDSAAFVGQMIDASNVGADNSIPEVFPNMVGFQDEFKAIWGIE